MTKLRKKFHMKNFNQIQLKVETESREIGERWHHKLSHNLDKKVLWLEERFASSSRVIQEKIIFRHLLWGIGTGVLKKVKLSNVNHDVNKVLEVNDLYER